MEGLTYTDLVFLGAIRDYQLTNQRLVGTTELFHHTDIENSYVNLWLRWRRVERYSQMPVNGNHIRDESLSRLAELKYINSEGGAHKVTQKALKLLKQLGPDPNDWAELFVR